jgi:hypothetical protein
MARFALVTVSSSRTTMSPALTTSPSRARTSPTTPPVGCCTFLTLDSTTIWPGAISAPEICTVDAQPPRPTTRTSTIPRPSIRWNLIDWLTVRFTAGFTPPIVIVLMTSRLR